MEKTRNLRMHMKCTIDSLSAEVALDGLLKDCWTVTRIVDMGDGRHAVDCNRPLVVTDKERERLSKRTVRTIWDWERMKPR